MLRRFDKVIVVSQKMHRELIKSGINKNNVELVYNGIVSKNYVDDGKRGFLNRTISGNADSSPIIGTIGRLNPEKGHTDFIKAARLVIDAGLRAKFVIVGDGIERENLEVLVTDLRLDDHVYFTGYLQNIIDIYKDLDLMVLPSFTEGLPNVVLEAGLMAVPVIATNVGGTPEVIDNKKTGILIEPGNPELLASQMKDFLHNRSAFKHMAISAQKKIQEHFNFKERTKRIEFIYQDLLKNKRHLS